MSVYTDLGMKQVINGSGKMTALGATAVSASIAESVGIATRDYVEMDDLLKITGEKIATFTGAEGGCPVVCASAGIAISVAALITGKNLSLIEKLPNSQGLKNEIILQKGHSVHYGGSLPQMVTLGGGVVIEVGHANKTEPDHIRGAITDQTVALMYVKSHHAVQKGMQSLATMLEIAKEASLPLIIDAAAEEDFKKYGTCGADLVVFSGGKALGGPTCGMVCCRKELTDACQAQYKGIGRAMKAGKESMIGLIAAMKEYGQNVLSPEEQKEAMQALLEGLAELPGVKGEIAQDEAGREIYRARIQFDPTLCGMNAAQVAAALKKGNPAIYTRDHYANVGILQIDPRPLLSGQVEEIIKGLKEILIVK